MSPTAGVGAALRASAKFVRMPLSRKRIAIESVAELVAASVRFSWTSRATPLDVLGVPRPVGSAADGGTPGDVDDPADLDDPRVQVDDARQIGWMVERVADRLPWHPTCMRRAVAARAMLARRGIASTIAVGVADSHLTDPHAWLLVGDAVVVGRRSRPLTPVAWFDRPARTPDRSGVRIAARK